MWLELIWNFVFTYIDCLRFFWYSTDLFFYFRGSLVGDCFVTFLSNLWIEVFRVRACDGGNCLGALP
jgi:hypothetical protein